MDTENIFNRRTSEKSNEDNSKLLTSRMQYKTVSDTNYIDSLVLFLVGIIFGLIIYFNSYKISTSVIVFGIYTAFVIVYYTFRPRKCKTCKSKMKRFKNDDDVLFCCDTCKTKFKCIIKVGGYEA
jgi:hypothetical protein